MKDEELPFVSIIVVNYNGKHHFEEFLESIKNLEYPKSKFELIVGDNGSCDGSVGYIKNKYPWVKLIEFEKNYGFAEGNNRTVEFSKGDFLVFINNDTLVDKRWLIELAKPAVKDKNAIYGSKMLRYDEKDTIVYSGGKLLAWGYPFSMDVYKKDINYTKDPILSFYADGCGVLISKKVFDELGGFDQDYFAYAEDYDLSWKAWIYGYRIYCIPNSKFYHKISSTLGSRSQQFIYLVWRNSLSNMIKYLEYQNLIKALFLYALFSFGTYFFLFIPEKNFKTIVSIIKAYVFVLKNLRSIFKKRSIIQKNRKINDKKLKEEGLILSFRESLNEMFYFIKRKNEFWRGKKI